MADDNADLRRLAGLMLEHFVYRLLEAANSAEVLDILKTDQSVDVLFTDVLVPGSMDGVELAKQAKAMHPSLIILLTSGSYDMHVSLKELHVELRGTDCLQKPYNSDQVDTLIRKLHPQRTAFEAALKSDLNAEREYA